MSKTFQCRCCGQSTRSRHGMLGGRLVCGCETAKCGVCHKCRDHCVCESGRTAKIRKIREAGVERKNMEHRKDVNYDVQITSSAGTHIDLKCTDYDSAHSACQALLASTKDEKLREMLESSMRSFGFSGVSHGDYRVHISAYLPRTDTGEKQTCGRRMNEFGPQERKENLDTWEMRGADKCCSYCGSLHPDRVLELVREHGSNVIEMTSKGYKWYVKQPNVPNASFGGIKYYRQHDTQEFLDELNKLIDAEKLAKAA